MDQQTPSDRPPLLTLLSNPGRYCAWAAHRMPLGYLLIPVLFVALAKTVNRTMFRFEARGTPEIFDHWGIYWFIAFIGMVIAAPIYFFVSVTWYWLRLKIVGVEGPVYLKGARISYLCALIPCVPLAAIVVWKTLAYDSPSDAVNNASDYAIAQLSLNVFALWGIVASYLGVMAAFDPPRKFLTAVLFLVFPLLFTVAAVLAITLGAIALREAGLMPP